MPRARSEGAVQRPHTTGGECRLRCPVHCRSQGYLVVQAVLPLAPTCGYPCDVQPRPSRPHTSGGYPSGGGYPGGYPNNGPSGSHCLGGPGDGGYPKPEKLQYYHTTRFDVREKMWTSSGTIPITEAQPLQELVPTIIKNKVLKFGTRIVAIEMNWSETGLIPGHCGHLKRPGDDTSGARTPDTWGGKYQQLANELRSLLRPTGIQVFDFRTPTQKKGHRIYDRFSANERGLQVSSNMSHASSNPSRIGAFEVHVVQDSWLPRCCPGVHTEKHRGPPQNRAGSIMCTACAEAMPETWVANQARGPQQLLLHSKLWTRRWPSLRYLLARIGAATIPPAPDCEGPIPGDLVDVEALWREFSTLIEQLQTSKDRPGCERHLREWEETRGQRIEVFAKFCFSLAELVPGFSVSREASEIEDGRGALTQARARNEELARTWQGWKHEFEAWYEVRSPQGEEVVSLIIAARPDLSYVDLKKMTERDEKLRQRARELRKKLQEDLEGMMCEFEKVKIELWQSFQAQDIARYKVALRYALSIEMCNINIPSIYILYREPPQIDDIRKEVTAQLCFVLDYTGSMGEQMRQVRESVKEIIRQMQELSLPLFPKAKVSLKMTAISYTDWGSEAVGPGAVVDVFGGKKKLEGEHKPLQPEDFDLGGTFTEASKDLEDWLDEKRVDGGGAEAEELTGAFLAATHLPWSADEKLVVVITDAPCHGNEYSDGADSFCDSQGLTCSGKPDVPLEKLRDEGVGVVVLHTGRPNVTKMCEKLRPTGLIHETVEATGTAKKLVAIMKQRFDVTPLKYTLQPVSVAEVEELPRREKFNPEIATHHEVEVAGGRRVRHSTGARGLIFVGFEQKASITLHRPADRMLDRLFPRSSKEIELAGAQERRSFDIRIAPS